MMKFFKKFRDSEYGAVTVDWVVLTAAVVALAGAAFTSIKTSSVGLTASTGTYITDQAPE
ncbi:hypothetical protein [Sedimentitalea arenosa]|jgi:fatty acid-binding protein DegV|uniref:Pilus assembly protein n=1 Tax=Sedimentitalea arenosa TaxID=2798803 RepID=A0A8J7IT45_9RHOB|nr:hypothetical protein [Arenibacterium arenosum]MBJ6370977.1 hypothetical protein [Arenibacterium arenosum]MBJ6370978.1 hypothetical protein [Arenibacterium arenosum]